MAERKRIYLCLAHMSEEGIEQKYIKEAFDTNWVVPLGPNVNGFEKDLEEFLASPQPSPEGKGDSRNTLASAEGLGNELQFQPRVPPNISVTHYAKRKSLLKKSPMHLSPSL